MIMRRGHLPQRNAFTLMEILVTVSLSAVLLGGIFGLYSMYAKLYETGYARTQQAQLLRCLVQQLADDLSATVLPAPEQSGKRKGNRAGKMRGASRNAARAAAVDEFAAFEGDAFDPLAEDAEFADPDSSARGAAPPEPTPTLSYSERTGLVGTYNSLRLDIVLTSPPFTATPPPSSTIGDPSLNSLPGEDPLSAANSPLGPIAPPIDPLAVDPLASDPSITGSLDPAAVRSLMPRQDPEIVTVVYSFQSPAWADDPLAALDALNAPPAGVDPLLAAESGQPLDPLAQAPPVVQPGLKREIIYQNRTAVPAATATDPQLDPDSPLDEMSDPAFSPLFDPLAELAGSTAPTTPWAMSDPLLAGQIPAEPSDMEQDSITQVPEILALEFRYFDGQQWSDAWDSRVRRSLPVAVEVAIQLSRQQQDKPAPASANPQDSLAQQAADRVADDNAAAQLAEQQQQEPLLPEQDSVEMPATDLFSETLVLDPNQPPVYRFLIYLPQNNRPRSSSTSADGYPVEPPPPDFDSGFGPAFSLRAR